MVVDQLVHFGRLAEHVELNQSVELMLLASRGRVPTPQPSSERGIPTGDVFYLHAGLVAGECGTCHGFTEVGGFCGSWWVVAG